jgi:hypothetical protein
LKYGMRGRLWFHTILLVCEGVLIIAFSKAETLPGAVVTMCIFSMFTQAAEGAIFGVVPYVTKMYTGAVSGFVGCGGNVGSVIYGLGFRSLEYNQAFLMMGCIVISSSFLSIFIDIPCHAGMFWGEDNHIVVQARERHVARQAGAATTVANSDANDEDGNGERESNDRESLELAPIIEENSNRDSPNREPAQLLQSQGRSKETEEATTEA